MRLQFRPSVALAMALTMALACGHHQTPTAVSSPSPVAAASPTPAPVPTPNLPGTASCSKLPLVTHDVGNCPMEGPAFMPQVQAAIAQVQSQHPEIFQGGQVTSPGQFLVGVIDSLDKMGLCAGFDTEEIQVTNSADFSEQYHLLTSRNFLRTDPSIYRATCHPAALPTPHPPFHPANPGCTLPSSLEVTCDVESRVFYGGDVESALDQVIREHPEAFSGQVHIPKVLDGFLNQYHQWFIDAMVQRGYCAWWDTEEVQVKKDNRLSEHYKIFISDGTVRRVDTGAYRATCWPAAF